MRVVRAMTLAAALLAMTACGRRETATTAPMEPDEPPPGATTSDEDALRLTGEGFEVVFHGAGYTGTEFEQPSMVIRAEHVELKGKQYAIGDVTAIIYEQGQPSAEIHAARGEVDEAEGIARLSGGVTLQSGTMSLEMDSVEWQDKVDPPQAVSTSPVRLRDGDSDLQASGMVMVPRQNLLALTDVRGIWSQKGVE